MSTKIQVEWRRRQVFELSSKGLSQVEIARKLQIHESTISRDIDYLKEQSKENIRKYDILVCDCDRSHDESISTPRESGLIFSTVVPMIGILAL